MKVRMLPPLKRQSTVICGSNIYIGRSGAPIDVDEADADELVAAGWIKIAPAGLSPWDLPEAPAHGALFIDIRYGALVFDAFAGAWRSVVTGEVL